MRLTQSNKTYIYFCATLEKHMWAHLLPFKTFKSLHRHLDSKQMREGSPIFTLLLPPLCFYMFFYMLNWFQQLLANCVFVPSGAEYMQCWAHQSWNNKSCSCGLFNSHSWKWNTFILNCSDFPNLIKTALKSTQTTMPAKKQDLFCSPL